MLALKQADAPREIPRTIRPLELRQYRYFVVLAEELHFARAAERLSIGQSNLSREIRSLEHEVGLRLFYRTSRHTELTSAGERLIESARRVLAAEEHARLGIGELKRNSQERLCIGICERIGCSRIGAAITAWRRAVPGIELRVVTRSGRALLAELESGLLDCGITAMSVTEPGLIADKLWTDRWVVALPQDHSLAAMRTIEISELARAPLALFAPDGGGGVEGSVAEFLRAANPHVFIAEHHSTASALATWVEAGCGVGLITASQGEGIARSNLILRPLRHGLPPAAVFLLRGDGPPSPPLSSLIECLRT
jgi:DNA-binding transcriptional LysR family regulator